MARERVVVNEAPLTERGWTRPIRRIRRTRPTSRTVRIQSHTDDRLTPGVRRRAARIGHGGVPQTDYLKTIRCAKTWTGCDSMIGPVIHRLILLPTTRSAAVAELPSARRRMVLESSLKYASSMR